jgi:hypothetical protein
VHILTAFDQMLGCLCGGDAPGWQIDQIIIWDEKVRWAVTCADLAGAGARTMGVFDGESSGLPAWHLCCLRFLQSIQRQERAADLLQIGEVNSASLAAAEGRLEAAEEHRELARKYAAWAVAARDARIYGSRMLTGSLPRHQDAAAGLAAAGGAGEVYRDASWAVSGRPAGGRFR